VGLLDRALEKNLHGAGSHLATPFAWQALETIRSVEIDPGQQRSKSCVTRGNKHVSEVLRGLGIPQLDPPPPPENQNAPRLGMAPNTADGLGMHHERTRTASNGTATGATKTKSTTKKGLVRRSRIT